MYTYGIIGAMETEVSVLISQMKTERTEQLAGMTFTVGTLEDRAVVVVQSGVGKVNAAVCAQSLILHFGVTHIINTGVAGAIARQLHIGDLVLSTDAVQHDMDVTAFGRSIGEIPDTGRFFAADEALLAAAQQAAAQQEGLTVHTGRIASGDQFIASSAEKTRIGETFEALCTEMEGAAIAQTCTLSRIPFLIVRSISDQADEQADADFDFSVYEAQAAQISAALVRGVLRLHGNEK